MAVVHSWQMGDWTSSGEIKTMYGLRESQIQFGIECCLIRKGVHYRILKSGIRQFHVRRMRSIASEIKSLWRNRRNARRQKKEILNSQPRRAPIVDTAKKRELAERLQVLFEEHEGLMNLLDNNLEQQNRMQKIYWRTLWERKDCPYCLGVGYLLNSRSCVFCAEIEEGTDDLMLNPCEPLITGVEADKLGTDI